jgi:hypothetical protein
MKQWFTVHAFWWNYWNGEDERLWREYEKGALSATKPQGRQYEAIKTDWRDAAHLAMDFQDKQLGRF